MKLRRLCAVVPTVAVVVVTVTGCYTRREIIRERAGVQVPAREIVVVESPPAPRVETMGIAPTRDHVWVPGHWSRNGDRWIWSSGRWELRPSPAAVYRPGHWERTPDGYIWREGYWR